MTVIAVTGASGFVGRHLCERLIARGNQVNALVRSVPATPIAGVQSFVIPDFADEGKLRAALRGSTVVIHLAARVHQMSSEAQRDTEAFERANVRATDHLVNVACDEGVRRIVFASSVKAVTARTYEPISELEVPKPVDPYGESKLKGEQIVLGAESRGLAATVVRIPLVYGPGMRGNMASLFRLVDRGIPLPVRSIKNGRSMVFVGNLVEVLIAEAESQDGSLIVNVADGQAMSTPELVRRIAQALGRKARLWPFPPAGLRLLGGAGTRLVDDLILNVDRLTRRHAWFPRYSVAEGMQRTAEWYRSVTTQ